MSEFAAVQPNNSETTVDVGAQPSAPDNRIPVIFSTITGNGYKLAAAEINRFILQNG